ncbi:YraN family protein [Candidatus Gracilibacteria bacterium]|nr:YraN family protein [Candidatus Gracilibacteria bacterium]
MRKEKSIGNRGEAIARRFLEGRGCKFLEQNYHALGGEIDLIFLDTEKDEYVIVEVKTRCSDAFGEGEVSITPAKFEKILSAAEDFFLRKLEIKEIPFFRIDAVIVRIDGAKIFCQHIEDIGLDDFSTPCNEKYF